MRARWILVLVLAALPAAAAAAEKAHAHGIASLDMALEGGKLTLEFEAPLEDLVGFERKAASDRERAALAAMTAYLESAKGFVPSAAAGCRLETARVETTFPEKDHAEAKAHFVYQCSNALALRQIEVALFRQYPRLKRIDARVVSGKGQAASRLTPQKPNLAL